jgi:hypothetical protein
MTARFTLDKGNGKLLGVVPASPAGPIWIRFWSGSEPSR